MSMKETCMVSFLDEGERKSEFRKKCNNNDRKAAIGCEIIRRI